MQPYIRTFFAAVPLSLMECAGWVPIDSMHSKCVAPDGFDQPRSYLFRHQCMIAKATARCSPQRVKWVRCRLRSCQPRNVICSEFPVMGEQGPDRSRILIGQGNRSNIRISSPEQITQPRIRLCMTCRRQNRGACAVNQQGAQVHVSAFADAQQGRLSSTRVLPWD